MDMLLSFRKTILCFITLTLWVISSACFAETVVILPNTVISVDKNYHHVTLDLTHGNFLVKNGATLSINDCTINGTLSKNNPILFDVSEHSKLDMMRNMVNVHSEGVLPHPMTQSIYYVMQIAAGVVDLRNNNFTMEDPFTSGLLITLWPYGTSNFVILGNRIENFHGALYLINTGNSKVEDNVFVKNSYGNIVNMGNKNSIVHNTIYFSGNNRLGNAIDVLNSQEVQVARNLILNPTCHAIYVLSSSNITIDDNRVQGGITYGVNVLSFPEASDKFAYLGNVIPTLKNLNALSHSITIKDNYFLQNRYGVAASDTVGLTVDGNYFVQRFESNDTRKFWTNNNILLKNITDLVWTNNLYKEAFTQEISGDNSKSFSLIPFPVTGGVTL